MTKSVKLNFIFINEYIYQIQHRFHIFEQRNNDKMNKITESLFCTSWSLKNYSFFLLRKKIKQNNSHFKYFNLLKKKSVYVSLLENKNESIKQKSDKFISKTINEYFLLEKLLFQLKIKNYNYYYSNKLEKNKFTSVFYKSNLLLLSVLIIQSFLFSFVSYKLSDRLNFSIIKNHYKKLYSQFSHIAFSKKLVVDNQIHKKKYQFRFENSNHMNTRRKNFKFTSPQLNSVDTTIAVIFLDKIETVLIIQINANFDKKWQYLVNLKKNIQNFKQSIHTSTTLDKILIGFSAYRRSRKQQSSYFGFQGEGKVDSMSLCSLLTSNKKTSGKFFSQISNSLIKLSIINFLNFYKLNFLILKSTNHNFKKNLYCNVLPNRKFKLLIKDVESTDSPKFRLIDTSRSYNTRNNLLTTVGTFFLSNAARISLQQTKNNVCFKLFQINFNKENIVISLDKKFFILKLKHFLIYLVFLKPKYELHLNSSGSFSTINSLKYNSIKFLIKNLKIQSKYFVHFRIQESNSYLSKKLTPKFKKVKQNFSSKKLTTTSHFKKLNLNSFQLTYLLTKITLNSILVEYLLNPLKSVTLDYLTQTNESKKNSKSLFLYVLPDNYPQIADFPPGIVNKSSIDERYARLSRNLLIKKKHINYLFINSLFSRISVKLKHYILIKNAKRLCLAVNSLNIKEKYAFKINLILLNLTLFNLTSLPEFVWYTNQVVILKNDSHLMYDCLRIFKKFLYLHGFIIEFNQIKFGHTLINYNKQLPGLDFLGFFIRHYTYKTNVNFPLTNNFEQQTIETFLPLSGSMNQYLKNNFEIKNNCSKYIHRENPLIIYFPTREKKVNSKLGIKDINLNFQTQQFRNGLQLSNESITTSLHPSKTEIKSHVQKLKQIIKNSSSFSQEMLILKLSHNIRIWSYYYHIISNKKILEYCDYLLFKMLWRWCCRRHPSKNKKWIKYKYFHNLNGKKWIFGVYQNSHSELVCLPNHSDINLIKL